MYKTQNTNTSKKRLLADWGSFSTAAIVVEQHSELVKLLVCLQKRKRKEKKMQLNYEKQKHWDVSTRVLQVIRRESIVRPVGRGKILRIACWKFGRATSIQLKEKDNFCSPLTIQICVLTTIPGSSEFGNFVVRYSRLFLIEWKIAIRLPKGKVMRFKFKIG